MLCKRCGKKIAGEGMIFGPDSGLCMPCVEDMKNAPVKCPVCGCMTPPDEALALLLTTSAATPQERLDAATSLVHVCPECHVLFFDPFQYEFIRLLKNK